MAVVELQTSVSASSKLQTKTVLHTDLLKVLARERKLLGRATRDNERKRKARRVAALENQLQGV